MNYGNGGVAVKISILCNMTEFCLGKEQLEEGKPEVSGSVYFRSFKFHNIFRLDVYILTKSLLFSL